MSNAAAFLLYNTISMKFSLHAAIFDAINSQLKDEISTLNFHVQLEVEIVELDTLCCGQAGEECLWHSVEISLERADVDQGLVMCVRSGLGLTSHQIIFDD